MDTVNSKYILEVLKDAKSRETVSANLYTILNMILVRMTQLEDMINNKVEKTEEDKSL